MPEFRHPRMSLMVTPAGVAVKLAFGSLPLALLGDSPAAPALLNK